MVVTHIGGISPEVPGQMHGVHGPTRRIKAGLQVADRGWDAVTQVVCDDHGVATEFYLLVGGLWDGALRKDTFDHGTSRRRCS